MRSVSIAVHENSMEPLNLYPFTPLMKSGTSPIPLLYPVFGPVFKETTPYVNAIYRQHMADGSTYRIVASIEEADYAVIPHPYVRLQRSDPALVAEMVDQAQRAGKPLLIDASGDIEESVTISNTTVLRMGQYRFLRKENEITVPIDVEDLGETYFEGAPPLREKTAAPPSLGFSGWAHLAFGDRVKAEIKFLPTRVKSIFDSRYGALEKGVIIRERTLRRLASSKRITPHFLKRASYSGNARTLSGDPKTYRDEFVQNLVESDYALSIRGDGNIDMRLYEAMSLGKIPVIVDTERVLPLEDLIDYRAFCVFVDFRRLGELERILVDFHASLTPEQFMQKQKRAREVFVGYLRPDAFTKYLVQQLRQRLS